MSLVVYWTRFAENKLDDIFEYYKLKASKKIALNIIEMLIYASIKLENNQFIGQKEKLLFDRVEDFRYLVVKNHKIIYWLNKSKNRIEIVNVFDTRQNPTKILK